MADGDTPTGGSGETAATARDAVAFLLPSYKTPLLASELLHAAAAAAPAKPRPDAAEQATPDAAPKKRIRGLFGGRTK